MVIVVIAVIVVIIYNIRLLIICRAAVSCANVCTTGITEYGKWAQSKELHNYNITEFQEWEMGTEL